VCFAEKRGARGSPGEPLRRRARGRGKHALPGRAHPPGEAESARAAALGADGASEGARSGRPPSRRRSRPRAKGTSGSDAGHRVRAGQTWMFAMTGTCVRKLRSSSDGSMRTCVRTGDMAANLALQSGIGAFNLQSKLQIGSTGDGRLREIMRRQGRVRRSRTPLSRWLLR
jgi:hypothetical protein